MNEKRDKLAKRLCEMIGWHWIVLSKESRNLLRKQADALVSVVEKLEVIEDVGSYTSQVVAMNMPRVSNHDSGVLELLSGEATEALRILGLGGGE